MELSRENAEKILNFNDINNTTYNEILGNVISEEDIKKFIPDGKCQIDPRNGMRIIYSEKRAKRPHDNDPGEKQTPDADGSCPVCVGNTTGIIDMQPLSDGFTFINKNLFPILYPNTKPDGDFKYIHPQPSTAGTAAWGMHFLQWPSNKHDVDFQNMSVEDITIVLKRLALLESTCLHSDIDNFPYTTDFEDTTHTGYIGIIKNFGRLVGGSLSHGHNQIVHTNIMPECIEEDINFRNKNNDSFITYMMKHNPHELELENSGHFSAIVPYFIKRPLQSMIYYHGDAHYLHGIPDEHLPALAALLKKNIASVLNIMPRIGREPAYNLIFHSGPGSPFYIEILPYTQETGGYEQLGIWVCQGSPKSTHEIYKEFGEF